MIMPPRREVRVATAATEEGARMGCMRSVEPVRKRDAYVECSAWGAVGREAREATGWGGGIACACGVAV